MHAILSQLLSVDGCNFVKPNLVFAFRISSGSTITGNPFFLPGFLWRCTPRKDCSRGSSKENDQSNFHVFPTQMRKTRIICQTTSGNNFATRKEKGTSLEVPFGKTGAPDTNRTCDPKLRRLVLYPTELRAPRGEIVHLKPFNRKATTKIGNAKCIPHFSHTQTRKNEEMRGKTRKQSIDFIVYLFNKIHVAFPSEGSTLSS